MDRPILFSGWKVRAILDGATQTRRPYKPRNGFPREDGEMFPDGTGDRWTDWGPSPFGKVGDRLWVRENAYIWSAEDCVDFDDCNATDAEGYQRTVVYCADDKGPGVEAALDSELRITPSIHMPRWASRLTLEITDERVERVQDISEEDAIAEGVKPLEHFAAEQSVLRDRQRRTNGTHPHVLAFASPWDAIYADTASWASDPWCWVVSFRRVTP